MCAGCPVIDGWLLALPGSWRDRTAIDSLRFGLKVRRVNMTLSLSQLHHLHHHHPIRVG